jgi:hypothetical protein
MAVLRRLFVLSAVMAGAAVLAAPGFSLSPVYDYRGDDNTGTGCPTDAGGGYPFKLGSAHFLVHYMSDISSSSCDTRKAITEKRAGDVLGYAEQSYDAEVGTYGYPAPLSDGVLGGDNRLDIYIVDNSPDSTGVFSQTFWDGGAPSSSATINLDSRKGLTPEVIAHAVMNAIQMGIWIPPNETDFWLLEESAEWMSAKVNVFDAWFLTTPGPPDMSLDCRDDVGTNKCDLTSGYANDGFSRWPFWQSVSGKYGTSFVKEVFLDGAAHPNEDALTALTHALTAHGTNLADTFTAWSVQQISGGYGVNALDQLKPPIFGAAVKTGITTATLPTIYVPVNHLATRVLEFDRGDGTGASACFAATLTLTVNLPPNIGAKPYFYWNGLNSTPVPLTINGNTATTTQPWDTCTWFGNQAYLSLPNPSTDPIANGQLFTVNASIAVDTTKPGQSALPPPPTAINGTVISVPASDVVPQISVFGPELLHLAAATPTVRLIVQSTGDGILRASLGSQTLGNATVRAGNNDVRWTVPKSLLDGLRRSTAAGTNVLTLTPVSPSGAATGKTVTRVVTVAQPVVKKPVKKPAKKPAKKTVKTTAKKTVKRIVK